MDLELFLVSSISSNSPRFSFAAFSPLLSPTVLELVLQSLDSLFRLSLFPVPTFQLLARRQQPIPRPIWNKIRKFEETSILNR